MGLTLTQRPGLESVSGTLRQTVTDVDFDSSYPTGGEALTVRQLGLTVLVDIASENKPAGYSFDYDRSGAKLLAFLNGTEVGNEGNLSTLTGVRVVAQGY